MGNPYKAQVIDDNTKVRVDGSVSFTDPNNQPGGAAPITREQLLGNPTTVTNGQLGTLTWDTSFGPDTLLDLTTPTLPAVLATGVYAVTVSVRPTAGMTAAGWYHVDFYLDTNGESPPARADSAAANATLTEPWVAVTLTYYIPVGGALEIDVTNHDGVNDIPFSLTGEVQRLS